MHFEHLNFSSSLYIYLSSHLEHYEMLTLHYLDLNQNYFDTHKWS